jgi:hypothetical protein
MADTIHIIREQGLDSERFIGDTMCNAWNHQDGCECGFGPPYDYIKIVHYRIPSERSAHKTTLAGRFQISIPIADMPRPDDLDEKLRTELVRSLEEQLQKVAQKSMLAVSPTARLQARITRLSAGSLDAHFNLVFVGGAIFAFFVKYADFKKGVVMFCDDLVKQSRHIIKAIKNAKRANTESKSKLVTLDLSSKTTCVKEEVRKDIIVD